jgi:membrane protein YqaA with SNARE-associated domain
MKLTLTNLFAFAWGFAEATLFFIVPDVLLSWLALRSLKDALVSCLYALAGALLGGGMMWFVGQGDADAWRALVASLPAIDDDMITSVRAQLENAGLLSIFWGPLSGTPYKIYALEAGSLNFGLAVFLLVSIPARLVRFAVIVVFVSQLGRFLDSRLTIGQRQALLLACWSGFYCWYFYMMPG